MEMFLKSGCRLMFKFDVYFRNIVHHSLSTKLIKKLQLTVQKGAVCSDVTSIVAL